jgi:hypothetical protein
MTKFEKWVRGFGVAKLAASMRAIGPDAEVTTSAIYQWLYGETEPRSPKATAMVRLSRGTISLADIYRHIEIARARRAKRAEQAVAAAPAADGDLRRPIITA